MKVIFYSDFGLKQIEAKLLFTTLKSSKILEYFTFSPRVVVHFLSTVAHNCKININTSVKIYALRQLPLIKTRVNVLAQKTSMQQGLTFQFSLSLVFTAFN